MLPAIAVQRAKQVRRDKNRRKQLKSGVFYFPCGTVLLDWRLPETEERPGMPLLPGLSDALIPGSLSMAPERTESRLAAIPELKTRRQKAGSGLCRF